MIKNNFFIPILTIALIAGGFGISQAYGHADPQAGAPGVASTLFIVSDGGTPLVDDVFQAQTGDQLDLIVRVSKQFVTNPALDGGSIIINLPSGPVIVNEPTGVIVPCIGGTTTINDMIALEDCGNAFLGTASFDSEIADYTVDCENDAADNDQDVTTPNTIEFVATWNPFVHRNTNDNLDTLAMPPNELECIEDWDFETDSDPGNGETVGEGDLPISVVDDLITIMGTDGVQGEFEVVQADLVLVGTGTVGSLSDHVTCPLSALTTSSFDDFITCTYDGPDLLPGDYCWDIHVQENTDNYDSGEVDDIIDHDGCERDEDEIREQFTVPPSYWIKTKSYPLGDTGFISGVVTTASDTITIEGTNGIPGEFEVTNVQLIEFGVGPLGYGVYSCPLSILSTSTFDDFIKCTWDADGGPGLPEGDYCWDVTVTENLGNYVPAIVRHNGCPNPDDLDGDPDEQFTIGPPPEFNFDTLSSPTTADGPQTDVDVVIDTVTLTGEDGDGTFEAEGALWEDKVGGVEVLDTDSMVECLPTSIMHSGAFDGNQEFECTWDRTGTPLAAGTYCWIITVEDTSMTYDPAIKTRNSCEFVGPGAGEDVDDLERFIIGGFNGCTPGYWGHGSVKQQGIDAWIGSNGGITPATQWSSIFDDLTGYGYQVGNGKNAPVDNDPTFLEALNNPGKGIQVFVFHAAAAYLNADNDNVNYPYTPGEVVTMVNNALAGGIDDVNDLKNDFAEANEEGCPINAHGDPEEPEPEPEP